MIPLSQQLLDREGLILPWIKTCVAQHECNGGAIWVLLSLLFCFIFAFTDKGHKFEGIWKLLWNRNYNFFPDNLRHCSDIGPCVKITSDFFCLCFWRDNSSCVWCTWTFQLHMRAQHIPYVCVSNQSHPQDNHLLSCTLPTSSAYPHLLIPNSRITLCRKRMTQVSETEAGKKIFITNSLSKTRNKQKCKNMHCLQKWATEPQNLLSDFLCGNWRIAGPAPAAWGPCWPFSLGCCIFVHEYFSKPYF